MPAVETVTDVLRKMPENSATGPDGISTRLLRECAEELAEPVLHLFETIVDEGKWPTVWREHWIVPIHKRKIVFLGSNYRGVHITSQLSKAIERLLQRLYAPFLADSIAFGPNQFAYAKGKGARDAVALLVLTWLLGFDNKKKFVLYCSDVTGAFDRVRKELMEKKLNAKGVHPKVCAVLSSWLEERQAVVVLAGAQSRQYALRDMLFQGTVVGPPLWNLFYEDARDPVRAEDFVEVVYADDMNAFKEFPLATPNAEALQHGRAVQSKVHDWGRANQVAFDPAKESLHVISRRDGDDTTFRILGILFDSKLTMGATVAELALATRWRIASLFRARRYLAVGDLIMAYKGQVLSFLEYRTAAIYHAAQSTLGHLDRLQDTFARELGMTAVELLLHFALAPLETRRDIAMLGLIHRSVLGLGPAHFAHFFAPDRRLPGRTRSAAHRHSRQVRSLRGPAFSEQFRRSAFGLVHVYNLLPEEVVALPTVRAFQSALQRMVKSAAAAEHPEWRELLSPRVPFFRHPLQALLR